MESGDLLRMGLTLALLLAVPGGLLWLLRRSGVSLPGTSVGMQRLRIVARTSLDQKHTVILLRRDAQEQLLLLGPNGPTILEAVITLTPEDLVEQQRHAEDVERRAAAARAATANARLRLEGLIKRGADAFAAAMKREAKPPTPSFPALVDAPTPKAQRQPRNGATMPTRRPRKRAVKA